MSQIKPRSRIPVRSRRGSASALIVLLLVLLVFFGVLSLVTTAADSRLASRRASWVRSYYVTDREATFVVGDLRSLLPAPAGGDQKKLAAEPLLLQLADAAEAFEHVELLEPDRAAGQDLAFRVWSHEQAIEVGLRLVPPASSTEGYRLDVVRWSAWQQPLESEETGGVWNGAA